MLSFIQILNQELDSRPIVFRKGNNSILGLLLEWSVLIHCTMYSILTCPPNLSARAKKSSLSQTTALCTLYVSLPHVMVRSEYAPVSSKLYNPLVSVALRHIGGREFVWIDIPLGRTESLLLSHSRHCRRCLWYRIWMRDRDKASLRYSEYLFMEVLQLAGSYCAAIERPGEGEWGTWHYRIWVQRKREVLFASR